MPSCGLYPWSTYVYCKAGRGRSTTIVICYLVKYWQMMPDAAYGYVKSIRPRVLLASAQWKAGQEFYHRNVKGYSTRQFTDLLYRDPKLHAASNLFEFDDGAVIVITEADLNGYDPANRSDVARNEIWADVNIIYRVKIASDSLACGFAHIVAQRLKKRSPLAIRILLLVNPLLLWTFISPLKFIAYVYILLL